jgi:hypothetical protein
VPASVSLEGGISNAMNSMNVSVTSINAVTASGHRNWSKVMLLSRGE